MECNKDEAIRAKEIAENKMTKNDFEGARKLVLKAKKLFPELENISQILAVCDVHCSAKRKIDAPEMDLYGILQVENLADEATIRKQYRKLALILHPDKNNFPGAEAAFKLIGEANMILSDKEKRYLYDCKCREVARNSNQVSQSQPDSNARSLFWTYCPFCKIKYEYYRDLVNKCLRCPSCFKHFIAFEIGAPRSTEPARTQNAKQGSDTSQPSPVQKPENTKYDAQKDAKNGDLKTEKVPASRRTRKRPQGSFSEAAGDDLHSKKRSTPQKPSSTHDLHSKKRSTPQKLSTDVEDKQNDRNEPKTNSESEDKSEPVYIDCQDVEFSNFDKDKEEHCFAVDQIWACYDTIDGMPRFYAHIRKVLTGFRLRITWLEAKPENLLEIKWVEEGLPVSCGKFVRGQTEETRDRLMFSHKIAYEKGSSKFSFLVYPKKDEIWAIFKDWDINWSSDPKNHKEYRFEIVEILSDFDNENGVLVAFMVKVEGFVSLFQKTSRARLAEHRIPASEVFRFSHRIPSVKLTGTERAGVPVGSCELDTASLPDDINRYYFPAESPPKVNLVTGSPKQTMHDSDVDKENQKFLEGQIWGIRRSNDGDLHCYGQIKKIEVSPLRLHVDILESCTPNNDVSRPEPCGLFKAATGGRQIFPADSFLYLVKAEVNGKNRFNIYPRENEIWILHNNFDSECTFSALEAGECQIVEVVENNGCTLKVLCLSRVPGNKSVFRALEMQNSKVRVLEIELDDLGRFFCRVPALLLTHEQDGSLRGSWELDLAEFPRLLSS